MQKHIKIYLDHFDLKVGDPILCEATLKEGVVGGDGFDIHHINGRGKGKDVIENLMCLSRKAHEMVHMEKLSKSELQYIHNNFLQGQRKQFLK